MFKLKPNLDTKSLTLTAKIIILFYVSIRTDNGDTGTVSATVFLLKILTCATLRAFALDCNEGMFSK